MRKAYQLVIIPDIPPTVGEDVLSILEPLKELAETREGRRHNDNLDKAVTFRDLVDLGLIIESQVP